MVVKVFNVRGRFRVYNVKRWQGINMYLRGMSESDVLEKVYSLLGGNHKVKRNLIEIFEIREVSEDEIKNNPKIARRIK